MSNRKPTGLHLKDGLYYARKVVPEDVRHLFDTRELMDCLGPDYRAACLKLPAYMAKFAAQIADARATVKDGGGTVQRPTASHRLLTLRELAKAIEGDILEVQAELHRENHPLATDHLDKAEVDNLKRAASGMAPDNVIEGAVGNYLGGRAPVGSDQWRYEGQQIAGVTLDAWKRLFAKLEGETLAPTHPLLQPQPKAELGDDETPDSLLPLSQIAELCAQARKPAPGTAEDYRVGARMFEEFLGEPKAIRDITRKDVRGFVKLLHETPSRYTMHFPGMSLPDAVKANQARAQPHPLMSPITVAKWHGNVRAVISYAHNTEIIPTNPAEKIIIEKPKKRDGPPRIPLAPEELARVFAEPYFGGSKMFGETQWALLVALHTGFRASEIAQLPLSGVRLERGVLCFSVEGELKNEQSRRVTPVHSHLLTLGLEKRVRDLRAAGEEYLFPDWFRKGTDRKTKAPNDNQPFANFIARAFNRTTLRSQLKITDKRKTFHSLRHNLRTALKRAGVTRDMRNAITGHEDENASSTYEHDISIEAMKEGLEKIQIEGFNIDAVRPKI